MTGYEPGTLVRTPLAAATLFVQIADGQLLTDLPTDYLISLPLWARSTLSQLLQSEQPGQQKASKMKLQAGYPVRDLKQILAPSGKAAQRIPRAWPPSCPTWAERTRTRRSEQVWFAVLRRRACSCCGFLLIGGARRGPDQDAKALIERCRRVETGWRLYGQAGGIGPGGHIFFANAETAMTLTFAQEFKIMRRKIDDEQLPPGLSMRAASSITSSGCSR